MTLPATSLWLVGDPINDTPPIQAGDLVLFKNPMGMAMLTVTSTDSTHVYFGAEQLGRLVSLQPVLGAARADAADQAGAAAPSGADTTSAWTQKTTMFRALMITYYVDNTTTPAPATAADAAGLRRA